MFPYAEMQGQLVPFLVAHAGKHVITNRTREYFNFTLMDAFSMGFQFGLLGVAFTTQLTGESLFRMNDLKYFVWISLTELFQHSKICLFKCIT